MKAFKVLTAMSLMCWACMSNAATTVLAHNFETGLISPLACAGNCPQINSTIVASGKFSGNFDLTRSMAVPYRTEVELGPKGKFAFGQEYWFGFNYRYEDWAKDNNAEIAPFQIHTTPSTWSDPSCGTGPAVGTAPFLMLSQNDEVQFITYGGKTMWRAPLVKNKWLSIVVRFKVSQGTDGYIEVWKDGVRMGQVNGVNSQKLDGCGQPVKPTYFKMGVYKWDWKAGRPATQSTRRQLFIDNFTLAEGINGFNLVSPGASTTPTTPQSLTNVTATPSAITSVVTWTSALAGDSTVEYGTTTSYGATATNATSVTSHSITLSNLTPNTLYHYRVKTKDSTGTTTTDTDKTFTTASITLSGLVSDDFSGSLNTTRWTFYNPKGDATQTNLSGVVNIANPANSSHDLTPGDLTAPRILQNSANANMVLEVKFNSNPTQNYQGQGIIVQQDFNNFLRFDITNNGTGTRAFGAIINSAGTVLTQNYRVSIPSPAAPYKLKVSRVGDVWSSSYAIGDGAWVDLGSFTYPMVVSKVGMTSLNNGTTVPAFTTQIDYFKADNKDPVPQVSPPVISAISITPSSTSASYSFTTDVAGSTKTIHNVTCSTWVGNTNNNASLVTSHSGTLTGLLPATTYRVQFCSTDASSQETCSAVQNFTTT